MIATVLAFFSFIYRTKMTDAKKERSFIMVKPDGVSRGLIAEIIKRFEQKGFTLVAAKLVKASPELVQQHYYDLREKKFYKGLCAFMSSGPVFPMVWEGKGVVATGRTMLGETDPANSKPGSIRGDFCIDIGRNIIHGSDSVETAKKEIALWFKEEELVDWTPAAYSFVYE
ncbi:nucleoside diphosphate kinase A1-like [Acanthaster planci]|uniref:Nucleoside diphosphate kinase n=1 Tax=Acanthaster planci TaxID=133434 RepID=A0A8B7XZ60_ACAPL|nr:nucleoside diphosphate kinase A1-like [Acanthaster planci]